MSYKWREGYKGIFNGADPNIVGKEIESLGDAATTSGIVDFARNEETELHKCFEWDNKKAAEAYRRGQVHFIVHHLVFEEQEIPKDRPEMRVFHQVEMLHSYKPLKLIQKNPDEYEKLLARAWAELHSFKTRYSMLKELDEIFALIK